MTKPLFSSLPYTSIPHLTSAQLNHLDQYMATTCHTSTTMLMEMAGYHAATLTRHLSPENVLVIIGKGNNGADGLVTACWLATWGITVSVASLYPFDSFSGVPKQQWQRADAFQIPIHHITPSSITPLLNTATLLIDGLVGCGLSGPPRSETQNLINTLNKTKTTTIALDIPSGLNATTGEGYQTCIQATHTITFAAPKKGFLHQPCKNKLGQVFLAHIGIPTQAFAALSLEAPALTKEDIIELIYN